MKHTAKKSGSGWLYRGYRLEHRLDENCNPTREYIILEWAECEWVAVDAFSTLRDCKRFIDQWARDAEMQARVAEECRKIENTRCDVANWYCPPPRNTHTKATH